MFASRTRAAFAARTFGKAQGPLLEVFYRARSCAEGSAPALRGYLRQAFFERPVDRGPIGPSEPRSGPAHTCAGPPRSGGSLAHQAGPFRVSREIKKK